MGAAEIAAALGPRLPVLAQHQAVCSAELALAQAFLKVQVPPDMLAWVSSGSNGLSPSAQTPTLPPFSFQARPPTVWQRCREECGHFSSRLPGFYWHSPGGWVCVKEILRILFHPTSALMSPQSSWLPGPHNLGL